jgi:hypothetical protein
VWVRGEGDGMSVFSNDGRVRAARREDIAALMEVPVWAEIERICWAIREANRRVTP